MSKRLDGLYRNIRGIKAKSGNASQVTYFIDLAHAKLRPGRNPGDNLPSDHSGWKGLGKYSETAGKGLRKHHDRYYRRRIR